MNKFDNWIESFTEQNPPEQYIPPKYEDTYFADAANAINHKLDNMISENNKAEAQNRKLVIATLIIGILTLIATIAGIVVQIL